MTTTEYPFCSSQAFAHRRGISLVELLVVVTIIGIIVALVIPALQAARESARRVHCANNLHQLGVALSTYAAVQGVFPQGHNGSGFSPHVALLPYLERQAVYDMIDFREPMGMFAGPIHVTIAAMSLDVFLCPSDRNAVGGRVNYAGNKGVGFDATGKSRNGVFARPTQPPIGPAAIYDGLSSTVVMAEWVTGSLRPSGPSRPDQVVFETLAQLTSRGDLDRFATQCRSIDENTARVNWPGKGLNWMHGDYRSTLYNHVLNINGNSCTNGKLVQQGAWTAGSRHSQGGHVLFADGHARFIVDSIAINLWRALGTRDGQEAVSGSF